MNTYESKLLLYGDLGNTGKNAAVWPNTIYANYYEVDTFITN